MEGKVTHARYSIQCHILDKRTPPHGWYTIDRTLVFSHSPFMQTSTTFCTLGCNKKKREIINVEMKSHVCKHLLM